MTRQYTIGRANPHNYLQFQSATRTLPVATYFCKVFLVILFAILLFQFHPNQLFSLEDLSHKLALLIILQVEYSSALINHMVGSESQSKYCEKSGTPPESKFVVKTRFRKLSWLKAISNEMRTNDLYPKYDYVVFCCRH